MISASPSLLGLTRAPAQKGRYRAAWTTKRELKAAGGCCGSAGAAAAVAVAVAIVAIVAPTVIGVACLQVVPAAILHGVAAHHGLGAALVVVGAVHLSWH